MGPFGSLFTVFATGVITKCSNRFLRIRNPPEELFLLQGWDAIRRPRELLVPEREGDKDRLDSMMVPMIQHLEVNSGRPVIAEFDFAGQATSTTDSTA